MSFHFTVQYCCSVGLNPCCNGIYSMSLLFSFHQKQYLCLNPCCNGIYSMRIAAIPMIAAGIVLILVVMEYTQ